MAQGLLPKITVEEISETPQTTGKQVKIDMENDKVNDNEAEDDDRVKLPKIRRTSKVSTCKCKHTHTHTHTHTNENADCTIKNAASNLGLHCLPSTPLNTK